MKTVVFKVKTVTPTFMGGGEGRFDGIRIPEIKGMMRWWFRALAGCFVGDDISLLKDIEGNLFGIANDSKNNQKSKFRLSIENSKLQFQTKNKQGIDSNGYTYLGIGNVIFKFDSNNKGKFIPNPDKAGKNNNVLIDAGSMFDLRFTFYPQATEDDINLIIGSFYLATSMGGFGLRGKKCFGSWQIKYITNQKDFIPVFEPKEYQKEGIIKNIETLKSILKKRLSIFHQSATKYPAIEDSKFVFEVIETGCTDYKALLDLFGRHYRGFRVCAENPKPGIPKKGIHTADFDFLSVRLSAPKNCIEIKNFDDYKVRNALFGLNIFYPQLKKGLQLERQKDGQREILRRASPIFFSVKEINGKLNLHITLFKSQFIPENSFVRFGNNDIPIEDYQLLENTFLPYIKKSLGGKNG